MGAVELTLQNVGSCSEVTTFRNKYYILFVTRDEHMAWCKRRALEYVEQGDMKNALLSMLSDLSKHEGTRAALAIAIEIGVPLSINGHLSTADDVRRFIEGFS